MILAVDLAARFSAGMVMGSDREIHLQFDSLGRDAYGISRLITETANLFDPEWIVIEDVPYGISKQFMVKPVLRLQGMLMISLHRAGLLERTLFVAPATWQREMGVFKKRGTSDGVQAKITADVASELGYTAPDLLEIHAAEMPDKGPERTKTRALLRKASTDYVDAYLIARWAVDSLTDGPLTRFQGVQPAIPEGVTSWPQTARSPQPSLTS